MTETEYYNFLLSAMQLAEVHRLNVNNSQTVAHHMPTSALRAVANHDVYYDGSVIKVDCGEEIQFYPFWVNACDDELAERLLIGDHAEED